MKAYEYRIYPTSQQEEIFNQTLGLCRLYWNIVVFNKNQDHNMQIEGYKQIFTKYKPEALQWSKEAACSIPLAQFHLLKCGLMLEQPTQISSKVAKV